MSLFEKAACWSAQNVMDLYVDARLAPAARARVQSHLTGCASCAALARSLRPVRIEDAAVAVPPGLADAILKEAVGASHREFSDRHQSQWNLVPVTKFRLAHVASLAYLCLLALVQAAPGPATQGPPNAFWDGSSGGVR